MGIKTFTSKITKHLQTFTHDTTYNLIYHTDVHQIYNGVKVLTIYKINKKKELSEIKWFLVQGSMNICWY